MRKELCSYLVINIHEEKVMLLEYCSYLVINIDERIYIVYFVIEKKMMFMMHLISYIKNQIHCELDI